jgi:hypothetical protein
LGVDFYFGVDFYLGVDFCFGDFTNFSFGDLSFFSDYYFLGALVFFKSYLAISGNDYLFWALGLALVSKNSHFSSNIFF